MSIWLNDSFKKLPDSTKALFGYLCDKSNEFGCFHLPLEQMASDMQKDKNEIRLSLSFLAKNGFAMYDEDEGYVLLKEKMPKVVSVDTLRRITEAFGDKRPAILSALASEMKRLLSASRKQTDAAFAEAFGAKPKKYVQKEIKVKKEATASKRPSRKKDKALESAFEEFWQEYPRKDGKDDSKTVFMRAVKTDGAEAIIAGAKLYRQQTLRTEQQYIMLPRTFLFKKKYLELKPSTEPKETCDNSEVNELLLALEA